MTPPRTSKLRGLRPCSRTQRLRNARTGSHRRLLAVLFSLRQTTIARWKRRLLTRWAGDRRPVMPTTIGARPATGTIAKTGGEWKPPIRRGAARPASNGKHHPGASLTGEAPAMSDGTGTGVGTTGAVVERTIGSARCAGRASPNDSLIAEAPARRGTTGRAGEDSAAGLVNPDWSSSAHEAQRVTPTQYE